MTINILILDKGQFAPKELREDADIILEKEGEATTAMIGRRTVVTQPTIARKVTTRCRTRELLPMADVELRSVVR